MSMILVVDDRPDSRYATVRVLSEAGYDVRETASGRDALRLARLRPDVIVLDVALVDVDGFEVCRQLRSDSMTQDIPVVCKTAVYRDPQHQQQAVAAGANEYLVDPVPGPVLVETVQKLIKSG